MGSADIRLAAVLAAVVIGVVAAQSGEIASEGTCVDGQCACKIYGNWTVWSDYQRIIAIKNQIAQLSDSLVVSDLQKVGEFIHNVTVRLNNLETNLDRQAVSVTMKEIIALQKHVGIIADLVEKNQAAGTAAELKILKDQIAELKDIINGLWERNPYSENDELKRELQDAYAKLTNCQVKVTFSQFEGEELPVKYDYKDWCEYNSLVAVGEPTARRWIAAYPYGAWFKDPLPATEAARSYIYYRVYSNGGTNFVRYSNYTNFVADKGPEISVARAYAYGVGFTIYNQSLYTAYSNTLYRYAAAGGGNGNVAGYDIVTGKTLRTRPLTTKERENRQYQLNAFATYIDFKTDEYGLWAVTSTLENFGKLVVYKVNPETLEFTESFATNKMKASVCAVFMMCGKLYTLDLCQNRIKPPGHNKMYVYDTQTRTESHMPFPIVSKFGQLSSMNYNAREHLLFAWDKGHLVTYPLKWKTPAPELA